MENMNKSKAVNIFFPILIVSYIGMSFVIAFITQVAGIVLPMWMQYVVSQIFILIPALLYALVCRKHFPRELSYKPLKPIDALLSLLTGYALIPMVLFIGNLSMLFATNHLQESADGLLQYPFVVQLIIVAVIPPMVEEFVFRGLFYHSYKEQGVFAGALMSGFIFGLFHLNINQFCYAVVMGVVFAYMVEATGSMWSAIIAHFAVNTYSIGMMAIARYLSNISTEFQGQYEQAQQAASQMSTGAVISQLVTLAGTAACFMFFAILMIRKMAKRNNRLGNITDRSGSIKKLITIPVIITALVCILYMVSIEM